MRIRVRKNGMINGKVLLVGGELVLLDACSFGRTGPTLPLR